MPGDSSGLVGRGTGTARGVQERASGDAGGENREWIIRNQLGRRNLTDAQRVQLALRLKPVAQAKAKERQKDGGATKGREIFPEAKSRATEEVAEAAGVSRKTVERVEKVNAKATPELRAAMNSNAVTINTAAGLTAWQAAGNADGP